MENYNNKAKAMKIQIIIFAVIMPFMLTAGGPWTKPKGKAYLKLSEWWTIFDQHFTDTGMLDPNITTGVFNTSIYGEFGITDRLTGIINAPIISRNYMNNLKSRTTEELIIEGESITTIGDFDLGIKYGLTRPGAKFPLAATLMLGLPTGKSSAGTLNNLQTGDGEFNQMLQLDSGTGFSLGKSSAYLSSFIAINNRTKGFSEEFRFGLEFGIGLLNKALWLNSKLIVVESFKNGNTAETVTSTSIFANNTEFSTLGIEANYYLNSSFGFSAGVATAFRGEIIAAAPSYSIGIFYDLK